MESIFPLYPPHAAYFGSTDQKDIVLSPPLHSTSLLAYPVPALSPGRLPEALHPHGTLLRPGSRRSHTYVCFSVFRRSSLHPEALVFLLEPSRFHSEPASKDPYPALLSVPADMTSVLHPIHPSNEASAPDRQQKVSFSLVLTSSDKPSSQNFLIILYCTIIIKKHK